MSYFVNVVVFSTVVRLNMIDTIDGEGTFAFHAIESKVPALAAFPAKGYSEIAIVLDFQGRSRMLLNKRAVLEK